MTKRAIATIAAILFAPMGLAGDWQVDPTRVYELRITDSPPAAATASENRWVQNLVENLRRGGSRPDYVYRFSAATAEFAINGVVQDVLVCVYRSDPKIFVVVSDGDPPGAHFIVNFGAKSVFLPGWGTIYVPPSRSFCTVVLDHKTHFQGIPVAGESGNPKFSDQSARWY